MQSVVQLTPSLVISAADNADALNLVLASLALQSRAPHEVLVADESTDHECARVVERWMGRLKCPLVRYDAARPHASRSPLLNHVVRAATGNYLIFIDADCLQHRHFISDHLREAQPGKFVQGRRAGIRARYVHRVSPAAFSPLFWFLSRRMYGLRAGLRRFGPTVQLGNLRTVHRCNFAVWREDFIRVNGFNEEFDERGLETLELATRLANAGVVLRTITGRAIIYHLDHRFSARYRSLKTARILDHTRREKISRCRLGIAGISDPTKDPVPREGLSSIPQAADSQTPTPSQETADSPEENRRPSHFRDKIVPGSMLPRILPGGP